MAGDQFTFQGGNLGKLLALPRYLIGAVAARGSHRDPRLWVVGSAFGPADGALAFYRAAAALPDPPDLIWLSSSAAETERAHQLGIDLVYPKDSRQGRLATLRAGVVAVTHGFGDVHRYTINRSIIVQLWHGAPLKKLHADSPAVTNLGGALGRIPGVNALMRAAYREGTKRISLFPTGSGLFAPFLATAFHLLHGEIQVLGEPRADVLFSGTPTERTTASRAVIAPHLDGHEDASFVLYAPTWRDGDPDPSIPTPQQWDRIEEVCEQLNLVLLVRPHPLGVSEYRHSSSRVRMLGPDLVPESMPLLSGVAALVTDYSSMIVDYVATGGHLLLLAPDLADYQASRGLYVDYEWLSGGRHYQDWDQVADRLVELFTDEAAAAESVAHSAELAGRFHEWTDGRSAERVVAEARRLVEQRAAKLEPIKPNLLR